MKQILLSNGLVALVDDDDFPLVNRYHWHASKSGRQVYAATDVSRDGKRLYMRMHREILRLGPGDLCDHMDGNGLNNTRANLRTCSRSENAANCPKYKRLNTSQHKGAFYVRSARVATV